MKHLLTISLIFLFALSTIAQQQTTAGATDNATSLVAKFPAADSAAFQKNMDNLTASGEQGLLAIAALLVPPGKGDNTKPAYALNGFSFYATQPGKEAQRKMAVSAYIKALAKAGDKEVAAFLIRQLAITGKDETVPVLQPYLKDERLCDPAARALVKINTQKARQALFAAVASSKGNSRLTLVEALGDAPFNEAVPAIMPLVKNSDPALKKVALYTLARTGDPRAATLLQQTAAAGNYVYTTTGETNYYITFLRQLAAKGNKSQAIGLAQQLLKACQQPAQVPARSAALTLLSELLGEQVIPQLDLAADDADPKYSAAALQLAHKFTSHTAIASWLIKLRTARPEVKANILYFLGDVQAKEALPQVLQALNDKDTAVRKAAVIAAVKIGGESAIQPLLALLQNGQPRDVTAVKGGLMMMKGTTLTTQLAAALKQNSMPPAGKAALIEVLASRKAVDQRSTVTALLNAPDTTVSYAAYTALQDLSEPGSETELFALLGTANTPNEKKAVQQALLTSTAGITDTAARLKLVVDQMNEATVTNKAAYFPVLSGIGGGKSLALVVSSYNNGDEATKKSVIETLAEWNDSRAAAELYFICLNETSNTLKQQALAGYLQMANNDFFTDERRLIILRQAIELTTGTDQKKQALQTAASCNTLNALVFAGKYLDSASLQQTAAETVAAIAGSGSKWNGSLVKGLLQHALTILKTNGTAKQQQAIIKYLADMPEGNGFETMFNGTDLTGWKGLVENPIARSQMNADTLAQEQKKADDVMRKGWFVKNGILIFNGHGENLCTTKQYGDFDMYVDWKIVKDGDAGIYLRGTPQVQIWDTSRVDVGAQVGSGGLYNNSVNPSKPLKLADNGIGEWNTFHIIMKGDHVTVYLNGTLVVNDVILENYWDHKLPIFPVEQIELQAHGTNVFYRDLFIKELPSKQPFVLSAAEKADSFHVLFDGTNMNEWTGNTVDYTIDKGDLIIDPSHGGHGNLYTKKEYSDFVYRFDFQLTPDANNGVGIRTPLEGDAAYVGMEIQVLDNEADVYNDLHPYQYHGSVYGVIPAKRGYLKPVGEWNEEEITAKGNKIKVVLNGTTILDGDIAEASKNGTADHKDHPGLMNKSGHIGFLGHGSVVRFRNIRIKDLSK